MKLPGNTAVIDGRIFPVVEWYIEEECDTARVSHTATSKQLGTIATARYFEGEMEILVNALPTSITTMPMHDIYLFPQSGTKNRLLLTDAIFSSVFYGEMGRTTEIEFVAEDIQQ